MNKLLKTHSIDEFGVKNYHTFYLLLITLATLYAIIAILAFALLHYELTNTDANIVTYRDAFWTLQMSASTIGFGDFYPITLPGRLIVAVMFYIGVGMVGFIGAQFINKFVSFSDTNVKNRELRRQNSEILAHSKLLESKIERLLVSMEALAATQEIKPSKQQTGTHTKTT